MKLKQIRPLRENEEKTYSFTTSWDGQEEDGLVIQPFQVKVTYYAEPDGHPAGGHLVQVTSLTADQAVKVESDKSVDLDKLRDITNLHAIVIGKPGTGVLSKLKSIFTGAEVLDLSRSKTGASGVWDAFHFFDDNKEDDVIIDLNGSSLLKNDKEMINLFKALLDGRQVSWKSSAGEHVFDFNGRLIIYSAEGGPDYHSFLEQLSDFDNETDLAAPAGDVQAAHKVSKFHKTIHSRTMVIDMTKDQVFPRGTRVQDIPGWNQEMMKHFEELAEKDFRGHD